MRSTSPGAGVRRGPLVKVLSVVGVALVVVGCSTPAPTQRRAPPVEDRHTGVRPAAAPAPTNPAGPAPATAVAALPGAENAGKPGYYTVRPGDTLIRIGLDNGQNWRDIQSWNGLVNPNLIEVGQVLRVVPPDGGAVAAPVTGAAGGSQVQGRPLAQPSTSPAPTPAPAPAPANNTAAADEPNFMWPVSGQVVEAFDENRNKGLGIAGRLGEPVLAAADGRVVYAGAGLRGYGNLVILKHNNTYLTAYAHNQSLLVKEDQTVRKGQKIAEMGSSDTDRVKLHFEVRRQGKPVDPIKYLPSR